MRWAIIISPLLSFSFLGAQDIKLVRNLSSSEKRANVLFEESKYREAATLYERAYRKDSDRKDLAIKIGECYHHADDYSKAEGWYEKGLTKSSNVSVSVFRDYAQVLIANGKHLESKEWLSKYLDQVDQDRSAEKSLSSAENVHIHFEDTASVEVRFLKVNTNNAEFSPAYFGEGMIFLSDRHSTNVNNPIGWDAEEYTKIFYTQETEDGELEPPKELFSDFNSAFHEGPLVMFGDGEMIFTRVNATGKKDESAHLELYHAKYDSTKGKWSEVGPLPFNNKNYSVGHPAVSPDQSKLVFASNMPGGAGGTDLYLSEKEGGSWSKPKNLGAIINTPGEELFPFFLNNNELIFSSSGHGGLGDLDLFHTDLNPTSDNQIRNLGAPYNSSGADFGLVSTGRGTSGYFTSNRRNGGYDDDIYYFTLKWTKIQTNVLDWESAPIQGAEIRLLADGSVRDTQLTKTNGIASFVAFPGEKIKLEITNEGYYPQSAQLDVKNVKPGKSTEVAVTLEKIPVRREKNPIEKAQEQYDAQTAMVQVNGRIFEYREIGEYRFLVNADEKILLAKEPVDEEMPLQQRVQEAVESKGLALESDFYLKNIYFDFDSSELSDSAKVELDKVVGIMLADRKVAFEINTFTDSRGSAVYNDELAFRRAQTISRYLLENDVDGSRLIIESYGENGLLNDCNDDQECEELFHGLNRRAEFKLVMRKLYNQ